MDILISFVGNRDPFVEDSYAGLDSDGPVLTLLKEKRYDLIYLYSNKSVSINAHNLKDEIKKRKLCRRIEEVYLEIIDPTSYNELLPLIWSRTSDLQDKHGDKENFDIATSSGTPQMHATWMLLRQEGKIRGTLLKITPPKFLKKGELAVSEIGDLPNLKRKKGTTYSRITPQSELEIQNLGLKRTLENIRGIDDFQEVIGRNSGLKSIFDLLENISCEDITVLLSGETGTGKELIARCIHRQSPRRFGPFITVNCGAIPENLVESTLFGHKKGAFTGAVADQPGEIAKAEGGTVFLDEIGDLPPVQQVKVLRFLQNGEIHILGGGTKKVDARVIAASNKDIGEEVKKGNFREDLFYRLKGFPICLPPLRNRLQDLPALVDFFLSALNQGRKEPKHIDPAVLKVFYYYSWPGNIRELENVIKRMYFSTRNQVIGRAEVPDELLCGRNTEIRAIVPPNGLDLPARMHSIEKEYFLAALRITGGNKAKASRLLGIDPKTFQKACRDRFKI